MKSKKIMRGVALFVILVFVANFTLTRLNTQAIYLPPDDLPRTVTYSGNVRDTDGNGLQGATVRFYSGSSLKKTVIAGTNGYYSFSIIQYSSPILKASKTDYFTQTKSVSINGGSYYFYLEEDVPVFATYTGYVRDSSGNGLPNAILRLYTAGSQCASATANSNGYYSFSTEIVSSPGLKAEKSGYVSQTIVVSSTGGSYNFYLAEVGPPTYTGKVEDIHGNVIREAFVELYSSTQRISSTYTDINGEYTVVNNLEDSHHITVSKIDYNPVTIEPIITTGGTYNFILEAIIYDIYLTGKVTESGTNIALDNVEIRLCSDEGSIIKSRYTDTEGLFSLGVGLYTSDYKLIIIKDGYYSKVVEIQLDQNQDFIFDIKPIKVRSGLNYLEDFENQYPGNIIQNWDVEIVNDGDIRIVDTEFENDLIDNYYHNKLVKFEYKDSKFPHITKDVGLPLGYPVLVSAKLAFSSLGILPNTFGYINLLSEDDSGNYWNFQIRMHKDGIMLFSPDTCPVTDDYGFYLNENLIHNKLYQIDIIFESQTDGKIHYSIYIDGVSMKMGSTQKIGGYIEKVELGLDALTSYDTKFYADDIYIEIVGVGEVIENEPLYFVEPICWVFAPNVENVSNYYSITHSEGIAATLSIGMTFSPSIFGFGFTISSDINVIEMYDEISRDHYSFYLVSGNADSIMHIQNSFRFTRKELLIFETDEILFSFDIDLQHISTKYMHLPANDFYLDYGWMPENPRNSGLDYVGIHVEDYDRDIGNVGIPDLEQSRIQETEIHYDLTKAAFVYAKTSFSYNCKVDITSEVLVDTRESPHFMYYLPKNYSALLGVQPYIIMEIPSELTGIQPIYNILQIFETVPTNPSSNKFKLVSAYKL